MTDTRISAYQPPVIKRQDLLKADPSKSTAQVRVTDDAVKVSSLDDETAADVQPLMRLAGRSVAQVRTYNTRARQPEEPAARGRFVDVIA